MTTDAATGTTGRLGRIAPGLPSLLNYQFSRDFKFDFRAGVSVAAVALPVAVAYAQLAGFRPEAGLYSCILPLVAYAIFGTSRQLIVNPDAAACAMIAASVAPMAGKDAELYWSLSVALALFAGLFCIGASFLRLGALANFLSKPILVGYLNGVAISIFLGQIGKIFGFSIKAGGIVPRLMEFFSKLNQTHGPTLIVGLGTLAVLVVCKKLVPKIPAALVGMIVAAIAVAAMHLDQHGVAILGDVPAGLPRLRLPHIPVNDITTLIAHAAGLALVLFSSDMLTARGFAERNRYTIDVDKELAALGAANIASALSQGFAVTGADSRTAMANSAGGRTQVTGIVAAAVLATVLMFFTVPLRYIPIPALGAVLVIASFSLVDVKTLKEFWKMEKTEVGLAMITTLGVVAVGAIDAILIAVGLALVRFVKITARPVDEVLGRVDGFPGFHSITRHTAAQTFPGIIMYRFNSSIVFFNAAYMKERVLKLVRDAGPGVEWFVIDMIPVSYFDLTGVYAIHDLNEQLAERGVKLMFAGRKTELLAWAKRTGRYTPKLEERIFPTLRQAFNTFRELHGEKPATPVAE
jgi:high affinity sulfate transporter 1